MHSAALSRQLIYPLGCPLPTLNVLKKGNNAYLALTRTVPGRRKGMQEMRLRVLHWESACSSLDHHVKHDFIILLQRHQSRRERRIFMWGSRGLLLHFISIHHNYKTCWNSAGWPVYRLLTNDRLSGVRGNQSYPINVSKMNKTRLGFVEIGLSTWDCSDSTS